MQARVQERITWHCALLFLYANQCCQSWRKRRGKVSEKSTDWWHFITASKKHLTEWIDDFILEKHRFSPMITCHLPHETIHIWNYLERLIVTLLFRILRPALKYLIPKTCVSMKGQSIIPEVTQEIASASTSGLYYYVLRIDIKSFYASIDRDILFQQVSRPFQDPLLLHYLEAIIPHSIDDRGCVYIPRKGIPLRSALSPFFGALYLAPVDLAFESMDVFYRRYMDDVIILVKRKRQYSKAKKRLFDILQGLKLQVSPQKMRMEKLKTFHYLGAEFGVSRNPQSDEIHVSTAMHNRCCSRAMSNVLALRLNADHAARIQRYLSHWSAW